MIRTFSITGDAGWFELRLHADQMTVHVATGTDKDALKAKGVHWVKYARVPRIAVPAKERTR